MKKPYGMTVFCDDIRDEVNGKKTYVGVYTSELGIRGQLPAVLPSFAFAISYLEPFEDDIEKVSIKILAPGEGQDDEKLVEIDLPIDRPSGPEPQPSDPRAEFRAIIIPIRVSPMVIHREGYLRVRAYRGDEEIRLGSLRIVTGSPKPAN